MNKCSDLYHTTRFFKISIILFSREYPEHNRGIS
jgi:hypothetical protein